MKLQKRLGVFGLAVAVAAVFVLVGCGQKGASGPGGAGDAAKPAADSRPAEEAKAPKVVKRAPSADMGPVVPVTLDVLGLMPDNAMVTMGVPSANSLVDKAIAFAKRVAPADVDIEAIVADSIAGMAEDAGVAEAQSLGEIGKAKGFDLDAPMAFFVDLSPMEAKLAEAAAILAPEEPAPAPAPGAAQGGSAEAEAGAAPVPAPADAEQEAVDQADQVNAILADMGLPAMAGVVTCTDVALAEKTLQEILGSEGSPLAGVEPTDVDAGGVIIKSYNDSFCYFVAETWLVAGNSMELVKGAAAHLSAPASFRYGTKVCPASAPDEIVELIRMDKLMPFVEDLMPVMMAMDPSSAPMIQAQMALMGGMTDAYSGTDPAVATLVMDDDKIEFLTRIDMAAHPKLMEVTGDAAPLRLATLLPETTELFLSIRFNEQMKASIQNQSQTMSSLPSDAVPQQVSVMLPQVMQMIGDELAFGLTGIEGLVPKGVVALSMGDPENTKPLLQMLVPMAPGETYNGIDIMSVAVPLPVALSIAFPQDLVLVSNDLEAMKGMLDLIQSGGSSTLFQALDPPIDATVPRYSALVLKTDMIAQVAPQVGMLAGGLPPEATMAVDALTKLVREVRASQELVEGWQRSCFTVYLNPATS
ncbi:MAG TPA: hypothetical protein PLO37_21990 [Candidatus Hydrogenedentes bacterium]|nr:hypothetical protein [Candidatus Hydrogenedentota bacterium]HPG69527.1 hypothetical protein [Candidatus Hydrogenedentota bacterium]